MTAPIRRADDVLAAELGDKLLMMSVRKGSYCSLGGAGTRIWSLLEQPTTEAAIVAQLVQEFDVPEAECAREVAGFVAGLRTRGLLASA